MKHFIFENKLFFPILIVLWLIGIGGMIYNPSWESPFPAETNYSLFCLSFTSIILILCIGGFLLTRWKKSKDKTTLIWAVSFLLYSITFFGLLFKSMGFQWANDANPHIFFMFRQFMIWFVAGMGYGVYHLLKKGKIVYYNEWAFMLPTIVVFFGSYLWFYYTLIMNSAIEEIVHVCMHGFLGIFFIPTTALVAFLFLNYGFKENINSMKILGFSFALLSFAYMLWAPFHDSPFYYVAYTLFVASIGWIFCGFILLSAEKYKLESGDISKKQYCKKCKQVCCNNKK